MATSLKVVAPIKVDTKKEEKIVDYIKSIKELEDTMEPFKEQKRDLKKNYVENWLSQAHLHLKLLLRLHSFRSSHHQIRLLQVDKRDYPLHSKVNRWVKVNLVRLLE